MTKHKAWCLFCWFMVIHTPLDRIWFRAWFALLPGAGEWAYWDHDYGFNDLPEDVQ